jgi:hypothetical protein
VLFLASERLPRGTLPPLFIVAPPLPHAPPPFPPTCISHLLHCKAGRPYPWFPTASRYVISETGKPFLLTFVYSSTSIIRLYFTTFPHPPPSPHVLNKQSPDPSNNPPVRARPRGGPSASPDDDATYYYFTIDDQLLYLSFFQDWGPLNLAMVYKACILLHELLEVGTASEPTGAAR